MIDVIPNDEERETIIRRVLEETADVLRSIARLLDGASAAMPEDET